MRRFAHTLPFALWSLATACGGDSDGDDARESLEAVCQRGCAVEASLACSNDDPSTCLGECRVAADLIPQDCQYETNSASGCFLDRPDSDWECSAAGEAALKEGVCEREGAALLACLETFIETECIYENDAECDDPTGTNLCPAGSDLADCA